MLAFASRNAGNTRDRQNATPSHLLGPCRARPFRLPSVVTVLYVYGTGTGTQNEMKMDRDIDERWQNGMMEDDQVRGCLFVMVLPDRFFLPSNGSISCRSLLRFCGC